MYDVVDVAVDALAVCEVARAILLLIHDVLSWLERGEVEAQILRIEVLGDEVLLLCLLELLEFFELLLSGERDLGQAVPLEVIGYGGGHLGALGCDHGGALLCRKRLDNVVVALSGGGEDAEEGDLADGLLVRLGELEDTPLE